MTNIECAVEQFREAAVFPARWPEALQSLAGSLHCDGATLLVIPTRAHLVAASQSLQPFIEQHFALPFPDPREQRVCPGVDEGFKADHSYFSSREISREPYYQEFLIPNGFGWNAAAALGEDLIISLKRGDHCGAFDPEDIAELDTALPWLRSASRVASMLWRSAFTGQLSVLERIGRGAVLLDAGMRVLDLNAEVQFGDGLDLSGGILHATHPPDRSRLQKFLVDRVKPNAPPCRGSSTLMLQRPSGKRPILLDVIACRDALRSLHSRAVALVLVTDLGRSNRLDRTLLSDVFGLTRTEAMLTCEISAGESLQHAAARLHISEGHARQRLKAIFRKTGTSRQTELVGLLARLPSR